MSRASPSSSVCGGLFSVCPVSAGGVFSSFFAPHCCCPGHPPNPVHPESPCGATSPSARSRLLLETQGERRPQRPEGKQWSAWALGTQGRLCPHPGGAVKHGLNVLPPRRNGREDAGLAPRGSDDARWSCRKRGQWDHVAAEGTSRGAWGTPAPEATTGHEHGPQWGQVSKDDQGKEG